MGAQQVKESRAPSSCNTITPGSSPVNSNNLIPNNCSTSNIQGGTPFGPGTSLRASRINKSKPQKEPKSNALNIFTEHNGR